MKLKLKCPAKINLTLKVFKKNDITGYHPIESIMQSVSLCDYLTVEDNNSGKIIFEGNSSKIAYDNSNLVIKALMLFFKKANIENKGLKIYLEKNIPIAAGLAGGSTDAAGMILALNTIYDGILDSKEIFEINSSIGSDINFCYTGGCALCKGKGDEIEKLPFREFDISIVKPKNLEISTKDAYDTFDKLSIQSNMPNDLEFALLSKYEKLKELSMLGFQMSGSGPSFFTKSKTVPPFINRFEYDVFENLKPLPYGVCIL